jgi:hypothetical protein
MSFYVPQPTQEYIDWYLAELDERKKESSTVADGIEANQPAAEGPRSLEAAENAALEKVMGIISQREYFPPKAEAVVAAHEFLSSLKEEGSSKDEDR